MSRRPGNHPTRRFTRSGSTIFHQKTSSSPILSVTFVLLGSFLFIAYFYRSSWNTSISIDKKQVSIFQSDFSCIFDVQQAIPVLKKTYGDSMHRVLHVGPDSCSVVSRLIKEHETEAWGVEPYDIEDADMDCRGLVHKGFVRVADIKFPLPYRAKSFSLVIISDAVDYLSTKYLNKTISELARISTQNLVIFTGYPVHSKARVSQQTKFGRPGKTRSTTWWARFFVQTSLEENETALKKFNQAASEISYKPTCQIFHLKSYH
ncbi:probable pectin methylesterase CGR3 [Rutidosis leptorrhynchoides]|uniref:probable pectin methylesterase CGR3 n=1 Tax=Rutidosis leptorrhynchoides TaxID=125765 RepID=UPI003A99692C